MKWMFCGNTKHNSGNSTGSQEDYSTFLKFLKRAPPLPVPLAAVAVKAFGSQSFSAGMFCHFFRAADEMICFLSGEIKWHIPQPDRKRKLRWFPEKLLHVVCKISNFYFGCRSISPLYVIIASLQYNFHHIHTSVHTRAYAYHRQGWDYSETQNAKPDNILK